MRYSLLHQAGQVDCQRASSPRLEEAGKDICNKTRFSSLLCYSNSRAPVLRQELSVSLARFASCFHAHNHIAELLAEGSSVASVLA